MAAAAAPVSAAACSSASGAQVDAVRRQLQRRPGAGRQWRLQASDQWGGSLRRWRRRLWRQWRQAAAAALVPERMAAVTRRPAPALCSVHRSRLSRRVATLQTGLATVRWRRHRRHGLHLTVNRLWRWWRLRRWRRRRLLSRSATVGRRRWRRWLRCRHWRFWRWRRWRPHFRHGYYRRRFRWRHGGGG